MKKLIVLAILSSILVAEEMCNVQVCNKIERVSLNPPAHTGDNFDETRYNVTLSKNLLPKLRRLIGVSNG